MPLGFPRGPAGFLLPVDPSRASAESGLMIYNVDKHGGFRLSEAFVTPYRKRPVPWGFGDLSRVIFQRSYSRDGERWWQTCRRVIEGTYTVQRIHCMERSLPWDAAEARQRAEEAYERMFLFKWTPPGRGLWIMGTRFVYERGGTALNNCAFVSTRDIGRDYAAPFTWLFHMSMLGVGVGFDTRGRGTVRIAPPERSDDVHQVADSREGFATALNRLLSAYVGAAALPARWDLSRVRPRGSRLESFGGRAGGPEPLRRMLKRIGDVHDAQVGRVCDAQLIVDTMNIIGSCVVAGGIRRSAQIAIGDADDQQFLQLKDASQKVSDYRWVANHSVLARPGMDYEEVLRQSRANGEPGFLWVDNARAYGRMIDSPNHRDEGALGTNPCGEQTLWDRELCCLVETYPAHHASHSDFLRTLELAYEYAKTVTLIPVPDKTTHAVMRAHRRIGCSMSGIVQAIRRHGAESFFELCRKGYDRLKHIDRQYSSWWRVPESIKLTTVKPSGTVSLLAGATPGVHWAYAPHFLRRLRVAADHPLADLCQEAGYDVEDDRYSEDSVVISFPIEVKGQSRSRRDVSVDEQVGLAARMQRFWSDNQVSCTATFHPGREGNSLADLLHRRQGALKAVSFLPWGAPGYAQPPYEEISAEDYRRRSARVQPLAGRLKHDPQHEPQSCESDSCELG